MLLISISARPCLSSRDIVNIRGKKCLFKLFLPNFSISFLSLMHAFNLVLKEICIRLPQHHKKQQPKTIRVAFILPQKEIASIILKYQVKFLC